MSLRLLITQTIAFYLGCLTCYILQIQFHFHPVTSAALTGFAGSFLHFPSFYEKKGLHALIYAGAFAGMCSITHLPTHVEVATLSFIGAIIFILSRPYANGLGGRLGTISFISSACFYLLRRLF